MQMQMQPNAAQKIGWVGRSVFGIARRCPWLIAHCIIATHPAPRSRPRSAIQIANNTQQHPHIAGTGVFPHVLSQQFWIHIKKGRADTKEPLIALLHVIYKNAKSRDGDDNQKAGGISR
jgi:hypothetical protein